MKKYIKFKVSDAEQVLIDINNILFVRSSATSTNDVIIYTPITGHTITNSAECLSYVLTFGTMDADKNSLTVNSINKCIEWALQTSWTNPIYDMHGKTPNLISKIVIDQLIIAV